MSSRSIPVKDSLAIFHEFSSAVCAALNDYGVRPAGSKSDCCALLVVVAPQDRSAPISASINFDHHSQKWGLTEPELATRM